MAHQITEFDRVQSIKGTEWHGLAEHVENISFDGSPIDYVVKNRAIAIAGGAKIQDWQALMVDGINEPLHIAKGTYHVIQNSAIWECLENSLAGMDYKVSSIGSLDGKKKVFVCVELGETAGMTIAGDKFQNYLTFASSHDGSMSFEAYDTNVRTICANTLQWSRNSKGKLRFYVRHTKNHSAKIDNVEEAISDLFDKRLALAEKLEQLAEKPLTLKQAENVIAGFVNVGSTRSFNIGSQMLELFQTGKGNSGATQYDLLNGVTEFYTHESKGKKVADWQTKQVSTSEFGSAANKKVEFFDFLTDGNLDELARKGEALLEKAGMSLVA
jgi:phage/plasmid-like protein (TIGR03299 family)